MKIVEHFATKNECFIANKSLKPLGIVLHSVGFPQDKAEIFARHFNQPRPDGVQKCVHAFVQADGLVCQTLPWEVRGWHAGGKANDTHIGIEMMEPKNIAYVPGKPFEVQILDRSKAFEYILQVWTAAAELCGFLCQKFGLDPMEDGVLISHTEAHARGLASGHKDPEHLWSHFSMNQMDGFRKAAKSLLNSFERIEKVKKILKR